MDHILRKKKLVQSSLILSVLLQKEKENSRAVFKHLTFENNSPHFHIGDLLPKEQTNSCCHYTGATKRLQEFCFILFCFSEMKTIPQLPSMPCEGPMAQFGLFFKSTQEAVQ